MHHNEIKLSRTFMKSKNKYMSKISTNSLLKCLTLLRDHCLVDFISNGYPSSLKVSFESE